MKVCGKCGHLNDDDSVFCVIDGAALVAGGGQSSSRIFVDLDNQQTSPENEKKVVTAVPTAEVSPPPRSPAFLFAALGALGAIVVLLGGYIILNSGSNRESVTESTNQATVQSARPLQDSTGNADNASVGERENTSMPAMNADETQKIKGRSRLTELQRRDC